MSRLGPEIDVEAAGQMRRHGASWREIGTYLAEIAMRSVPFQGLSVHNAVKRAAKKGAIEPVPIYDFHGRKKGQWG